MCGFTLSRAANYFLGITSAPSLKVKLNVPPFGHCGKTVIRELT